MQTLSHREDWGILFAIQGEVDHLEGRRLFDDLFRSLNGPLVIDASGIEYIDTGGIAAIMEILKHVRTRRGLLVIASPSPHVRQIFEIAGFSKLSPWLMMTGTVEEAVAMAQQWNVDSAYGSSPAKT
jgi:anti-sigma B factor antagonist